MRTIITESHWPADRSGALLETTPARMLRDAASQVPHRAALVGVGLDGAGTRTWTYAEMLGAAEKVAQALRRRFEPGERVAIWAANRPEWLLVQHGLGMAGLIMVTVNPAFRNEELAYVLRQSRSAGVFFDERYRGFDMGRAIEEVRPQLNDLREAICFEDWDAFVASGGAGEPVDLPAVSPDSPAQIQYTSGTTGFPKGALLHHRGVVNASAFVAERAGFEEGDVWVNAMPMFHIGGVGQTSLGTLSRRGTYVLLPRFDAGEALEAIEAHRGSVFLAVPTMLLRMLEHPERARRDLSSLKTLYSGATTVPAALVERVKEAFGCSFAITFGQTELHGTVCQTGLNDSTVLQAETVGRPMPHSEMKIADPETGETLPLGRPGEICVRGYQTMLEYFDMPDATASTLQEDGWLRTGDLGTMDEHGYVRIAGRLKDVIIRGGENIYPREIEELLLLHPMVAEAAVIGVPDSQWGERVVAVLRLAGDAASLSADELHTFCRERLASYKTPVGWCFVEVLPCTATGKIQKHVLRERVDSGELAPEAIEAKRSPNHP